MTSAEPFDPAPAATVSTPQVSVLVTTFNHARYVEEALESLRCQTSRDFEVIITDDASTDGCADVIEAWLKRTGFQARFVRNPVNRGICANRNAALACTSGRFVCSLSGDDGYQPERIERQLRFFLTQPARVAAVYSDMLVVDSESRWSGETFLGTTLDGAAPPQGKLFFRLLTGNFLPAPAVMVRRSAIAEVGGYDESLFFEDFDMWLRLGHRFDFAYLPGLLVRYRKHEDSMSISSPFQAFLLRSHSQILVKWLNAGLDGGMRRLLLNELMRNATAQLRIGDRVGTGQTLDIVAATDRRLLMRLMARIGKMPGSVAGVWLLLPFYRGYRRLRRWFAQA